MTPSRSDDNIYSVELVNLRHRNEKTRVVQRAVEGIAKAVTAPAVEKLAHRFCSRIVAYSSLV
jgi:hypothetical protein